MYSAGVNQGSTFSVALMIDPVTGQEGKSIKPDSDNQLSDLNDIIYEECDAAVSSNNALKLIVDPPIHQKPQKMPQIEEELFTMRDIMRAET